MSMRTRITSLSMSILAILVVVVTQTLVFSDRSNAQDRDDESTAPAPPPPTSQSDQSLFSFENVGNLNPVGVQGSALFSPEWYGSVDSDAGGSGGFANESSPDTVAMIWPDPYHPYTHAYITLMEPVEAISFDYALDTDFGTPTVSIYDDSWGTLAFEGLDVCGSVTCGNSCIGDPSGGLCHFQRFEFTAAPGRNISKIRISAVSETFDRFALDEFRFFSFNPIFGDGFEIGTTGSWSEAVGLPTPTATPTFTPTRSPAPHGTPTPTPTPTPTITPTMTPPYASCSFIRVGDLTRVGTNQVRIDHVHNNSVLILRHTRTELSWVKADPDQVFDFARFNEIGYIRTADDPLSPTEADLDIDFNPDQFSQFTAGWRGWDFVNSPMSGLIEVEFTFDFPKYSTTCTVTRSLSLGAPNPTSAPVSTPTLTPKSTR